MSKLIVYGSFEWTIFHHWNNHFLQTKLQKAEMMGFVHLLNSHHFSNNAYKHIFTCFLCSLFDALGKEKLISYYIIILKSSLEDDHHHHDLVSRYNNMYFYYLTIKPDILSYPFHPQEMESFFLFRIPRRWRDGSIKQTNLLFLLAWTWLTFIFMNNFNFKTISHDFFC